MVLKPLILALMLAGNHAGELSLFSPLDHRIHGAAIYGVPWIPSIYPIKMLAYGYDGYGSIPIVIPFLGGYSHPF